MTAATAPAARRRRSYSQLSTYLECPQLFKFKYVDRIPEDPSVWSIGGTAFHSCAEVLLRGDLGTEPGAVELFRLWNESWLDARDEVVAKNPHATTDLSKWRAANRGTETATWWQENGLGMVKRFDTWRRGAGASLQPLLDTDGPMLERRIEIELGGVPVVVIPDALVVDEHGQVDVLDYKSSKDQRGPAGSLQLGVYKAGLEVATGVRATFGLYYMTRSGTLQLRDLTGWTPEVIGEMFANFDARETAGHYEPTPGDACKFCPFKKPATPTRPQCPAYQKES